MQIFLILTAEKIWQFTTSDNQIQLILIKWMGNTCLWSDYDDKRTKRSCNGIPLHFIVYCNYCGLNRGCSFKISTKNIFIYYNYFSWEFLLVLFRFRLRHVIEYYYYRWAHVKFEVALLTYKIVVYTRIAIHCFQFSATV